MISVILNTYYLTIFTNISGKMKEYSNEYELCIREALDNAKKRINLLSNYDKKSVFDEYKEWFNDGLNNHTILLLRDDPII